MYKILIIYYLLLAQSLSYAAARGGYQPTPGEAASEEALFRSMRRDGQIQRALQDDEEARLCDPLYDVKKRAQNPHLHHRPHTQQSLSAQQLSLQFSKLQFEREKEAHRRQEEARRFQQEQRKLEQQERIFQAQQQEREEKARQQAQKEARKQTILNAFFIIQDHLSKGTYANDPKLEASIKQKVAQGPGSLDYETARQIVTEQQELNKKSRSKKY